MTWLSLLEKATFPGLSIRVTGGPDPHPVGPTDVTARARPAADPLVPVLETHAFRLTPIEPNDMGFLYTLAIQPETCFRWRYRGAPPPFDRFTADLWKQVLVQYVARRADDNEPVGLVVAYGANVSLRHAYLGAVFQPRCAGTGLAAQIVALFARHLFHTFPLRKQAPSCAATTASTHPPPAGEPSHPGLGQRWRRVDDTHRSGALRNCSAGHGAYP